MSYQFTNLVITVWKNGSLLATFQLFIFIVAKFNPSLRAELLGNPIPRLNDLNHHFLTGGCQWSTCCWIYWGSECPYIIDLMEKALEYLIDHLIKRLSNNRCSTDTHLSESGDHHCMEQWQLTCHLPTLYFSCRKF